ncbi:hypothetical protein BKH41_03905 [Helicobacter sp. 12S02232-10]|uniref:hypothetical protein n=1 Tax=Helicobacter sp. 12S02232-10 TaxID=1476197 RepID=UPI000BA6D06D|nr:hypothetical protein [Helicobacter sp. 12S02232-10]PAF49233.1 hypothetical protein BKH41_03905 [Helicobacter sp. 12S02232-10]
MKKTLLFILALLFVACSNGGDKTITIDGFTIGETTIAAFEKSRFGKCLKPEKFSAPNAPDTIKMFINYRSGCSITIQDVAVFNDIVLTFDNNILQKFFLVNMDTCNVSELKKFLDTKYNKIESGNNFITYDNGAGVLIDFGNNKGCL